MSRKIYLSPSNQNANVYKVGNTNEMVQCNRIAESAKYHLERHGFEVKKAPQGQNMWTSINESNSWGANLHVPKHIELHHMFYRHQCILIIFFFHIVLCNLFFSQFCLLFLFPKKFPKSSQKVPKNNQNSQKHYLKNCQKH